MGGNTLLVVGLSCRNHEYLMKGWVLCFSIGGLGKPEYIGGYHTHNIHNNSKGRVKRDNNSIFWTWEACLALGASFVFVAFLLFSSWLFAVLREDFFSVRF